MERFVVTINPKSFGLRSVSCDSIEECLIVALKEMHAKKNRRADTSISIKDTLIKSDNKMTIFSIAFSDRHGWTP